MDNFEFCSIVRVELKAVWKGLRLVRELGFKKFWIQLDSIIVIGMSQGSSKWKAKRTPISKQKKELID